MQTFVDSKLSQIELMVKTNGLHAMGQRLVSRLPQVEEAYRVAFTGNIDDEASPQSQQGREMLRASFCPMIEGYEAVMGQSPKLHFHFASSRSFVRLWREKQTMRDGKWVDISDDLSLFGKASRTSTPPKRGGMGSRGWQWRAGYTRAGPGGGQQRRLTLALWKLSFRSIRCWTAWALARAKTPSST